MRRILQVVELPSKVTDARKNVYYILTQGNLYTLAKQDHQIQQVFYKGERGMISRPRLLKIGVLLIESMFAIGLVVEGGVLHLLNPMNLQSFAAF